MLSEDIYMWFWVTICNSLQSASLSLSPQIVVFWDGILGRIVPHEERGRNSGGLLRDEKAKD